jgi:hypothetical protein
MVNTNSTPPENPPHISRHNHPFALEYSCTEKGIPLTKLVRNCLSYSFQHHAWKIYPRNIVRFVYMHIPSFTVVNFCKLQETFPHLQRSTSSFATKLGGIRPFHLKYPQQTIILETVYPKGLFHCMKFCRQFHK